MENITSYQIIGALIVACLGFLFRVGLEFKELKRFPKIGEGFVLGIFSFGFSVLMFLYVISKKYEIEFKLILICAASFFGSVVIPGVGAIKPAFFTSVMKDIIRKWVNNNDTNTEIQSNETLPADEADTSDLEQ